MLDNAQECSWTCASHMVGPQESLLRNALRVATRVVDCSFCGIVWQSAKSPVPLFAGFAPATPSVVELENWLSAEPHASQCSSLYELLLIPVADAPDDSAALVIRPRNVTRLDATTQALLSEIAADMRDFLTTSEGLDKQEVAPYEALFEIATQIQDVQVDLQDVLNLIVDRGRELLGSDVGWLALVDGEQQRVVVSAAAGVTSEAFRHMEVDVGTGIGGIAVEHRAVVVVPDQARYGNGMPRAVHKALQNEGVVSVACAPMLRGDRIIGALYVGSRQVVAYPSSATSLLSALAAQAAVAIENARLYHDLCDKNQTLEDAFVVHRSLTDLTLAGAGLEEIVRELACLVGSAVSFAPSSDAVGAAGVCSGAVADETDGESQAVAYREVTIPVRAGSVDLGVLTVTLGLPATELQRRTLEHGATVIALELAKQKAALEVEWRLKGELLDELLQSEGEYAEGLLFRAARVGVDVNTPRRLVAMRAADPGAAAAFFESVRVACQGAGAERQALIAQRRDTVVIAFRAESGVDAKNWADGIRLKAYRAGMDSRAGVSASRVDLTSALRQAQAALRLAASSSKNNKTVVYEDLGLLRFLLDTPSTAEMRDFVVDALGPLVEQDSRRRAQNVKTLRAYLYSGGHHPTTAAECHIHASTLKYRLAQISEMLDCSLNDASTRFRLTLAFEVLEMLEALDDDPFRGAAQRLGPLEEHATAPTVLAS